MKEVIKTYPKNITNYMKTIHNCLKYNLQAEDLEKAMRVVPIISRHDEQGNNLDIEADSVVRTIWKGVGEGAAREMQREGYKQEVIDIANRRTA